MPKPALVSEIRIYQIVSAPDYFMVVYVAEDGSLRRIDSLETFEPGEDHRLAETIYDPLKIAEILIPENEHGAIELQQRIYGTPPN